MTRLAGLLPECVGSNHKRPNQDRQSPLIKTALPCAPPLTPKAKPAPIWQAALADALPLAAVVARDCQMFPVPVPVPASQAKQPGTRATHAIMYYW